MPLDFTHDKCWSRFMSPYGVTRPQWVNSLWPSDTIMDVVDQDQYWIRYWFVTCYLIIPPASTKLIGGYTGITLSVCPSVDRIVSALYLQQYSSDPFHICTSYQATSEGVSRVMPVSKFKNLKFWRIFKICNFDFVIFWLGIQYDSMVWVIMRRRGVSSERRRSSCSSSGLIYRYFKLNPLIKKKVQ